ncbi:MAG: hypothetical protein AVDCRST_MAG88-1733, partial [uncultured Thermomicrobiales bacterium]
GCPPARHHGHERRPPPQAIGCAGLPGPDEQQIGYRHQGVQFTERLRTPRGPSHL